jgi:hypothetical protein
LAKLKNGFSILTFLEHFATKTILSFFKASNGGSKRVSAKGSSGELKGVVVTLW